MYLFFDTETTGLPIDYKAHVHEVDNWPRMVQLAWAMADEEGKIKASRNHLIKPDGFEIPEEVSKIHGITTEMAMEHGEPLEYSLGQFRLSLALSDTLVAHNVNFDKKIVGAEYIRAGHEECYQSIKDIDKICTMFKSTKYCGLKNGNRPKWPKLQELHMKLFDKEFEDAHDAVADVDALVRCFFELKKLEII